MKGLKKVYKEIPHTADLAIEVHGGSLKELFENAGVALSQLVFGTSLGVDPKVRMDFNVSGVDLEDLFVRFLSELHYIIFGRMFVYGPLMLTKGPDPEKLTVSGYVVGEPFDPGKHGFEVEIKAVTYHMVSVKESGGVWKGRVVFDV